MPQPHIPMKLKLSPITITIRYIWTINSHFSCSEGKYSTAGQCLKRECVMGRCVEISASDPNPLSVVVTLSLTSSLGDVWRHKPHGMCGGTSRVRRCAALFVIDSCGLFCIPFYSSMRFYWMLFLRHILREIWYCLNMRNQLARVCWELK